MPSLSIHQQTKLPGVLTDLCHVFFKYNTHFINVMARFYRRTNRKYGGLKRRKSRYGRKFVRKYGRKSFKRSGRGMQRLQRRRYPARNPFGDKVQVKFRFTNGSRFTVTNTSFVQNVGAFNDLAAAESTFGACPGFFVYPTLFQNYRVTGLKIRFTPMMNPDNADQGPATAFILGSDGILSNPSIATIPEQRWCTYKNLNNWYTGGQTKSLSLYLSTMKVGGGDRTIANDDQYTSTTNTSSPYYNAVPSQLGYQYGLLNCTNTIWPGTVGNNLCVFTVTFTYYVTFWGRRSIIQ